MRPILKAAERVAAWHLDRGQDDWITEGDRIDNEPYRPGYDDPDLWLAPAEVLRHADPDNETYPEAIEKHKQRITERGGIRHPIAIATDGRHAYVDDGHHRAMAAQQLGMDKVPVQVIPTTGVEWARKLQGPLKDWWNSHTWHGDLYTHPTWEERTAARRLEAIQTPGPEYSFRTFDRGDSLSRQVAERQGWELATYPGVAAFHNRDGLIGHLEFYDDDDAEQHGVRPGEITNIEIDPEHQRKGLGTQMFNIARDELDDRVHHSDELSPDAEEWIKGMQRG